MDPLGFLFFVIRGVLNLLVFAIIASAIVSWLVAFNVINLRNPFIYSIARGLDAITQPVLRPFQRFIPPLGGVDVTPIIVILLIQGALLYLIPRA